MMRQAFAAAIAGVTGVLMGLGMGVLVADGDALSAAFAAVLALGLWMAVRLSTPPEHRMVMVRVALLAFGLRVAAAVLLQAGSLAIGRGGFITGDDQGYANLAWGFARYLVNDPQPPHVPPHWANDGYLFGTWVYLESGLFLLFGKRVIIGELVNGALSVVTVLLIYDLGRRVFGARAGLIAGIFVALYPSIVLWSSLNLKDSLALLLLTVTLWAIARFQDRPRWVFLVAAFAVLVPMESLRRYMFVGLALVIPAAVLLAPRLTRIQRLRWGTIAVLTSAVFLGSAQAGLGFGPGLITALEGQRSAMAAGARTSFAPPLVQVQTGDTFVVGDGTSTCAPFHISPNDRIVIVNPDNAERHPGACADRQDDTVFARPGNVLVVGPPETTAAPAPNRRPITNARDTQLTSVGTKGEELAFARTLSYLPRGFVYALFAPFPWAPERLLDLLTIPEMLAWYGIMPAAGITVIRARSRWRLYAPILLFVLGTLTIFVLAEGNVGTLYRHRSMIIPATVILAAPTLISVWRRLRRQREALSGSAA